MGQMNPAMEHVLSCFFGLYSHYGFWQLSGWFERRRNTEDILVFSLRCLYST